MELNSDSDKILDEIEENIPNNKQFSSVELKQLEQLAQSKDESVRSRVAVILASFTEVFGENLLIQLTQDSDSLVRTEACDSLRYSKSFKVMNLLETIGENDEDYFVRGYAISSLGEIAIGLKVEKKIYPFFEKKLMEETEIFVRINLLEFLSKVEGEEYLNLLLGYLNTTDYRNRCSVIHSLEEVVNRKNSIKIKKALEERLNVEKARAVSSSIESFLQKIDKNNEGE